MKIKSFVGGHTVNIFAGCEFDPAIRKFRGGSKVAEIPFSGRTLNAHFEQNEAEPIEIESDGISIPTMSSQIFTSVDELPPVEECDFCIVSALFVAACKAVGRDTSRLLTIGTPVVDEAGRTIGCISLTRN